MYICAVEGCEQPSEGGRKTCADPSHRRVETEYDRRGKAAFQLKGRLLRSQVSRPVDADEVVPDDDVYEHVECPTRAEMRTAPKKHTAVFGRRRTHNEQIIVRPCGMIVARETFFGSETTPQVLVRIFILHSCRMHIESRFYFQSMLEHVFPCERSMPSFVIYGTGCGLYKHSVAQGKTLHLRCALPVDVFHHKTKHKETDVECQQHCNPANFPELLSDDGGWVFNTSIAEQTNVWLGGYHSMLREMTVEKYNFFLDELIMRKNEVIKHKLEVDGQLPSYIPGIQFSTST